MAIWRPRADEPIASNEHLGRRLFDEPMLAGVQTQPNYQGLLVRHFQEKRDREFSLDRLGRSSVDRRVTSYLAPKANVAGQTMSPAKPFHGWAVLRAGVLLNPPSGTPYPLTPSPVAGSELVENIYHAHLILPEGNDDMAIALRLRWLFTSKGTVEAVGTAPRRIEAVGGLRARVRAGASRCLNWILRQIE
jgi:hypothetical protein